MMKHQAKRLKRPKKSEKKMKEDFPSPSLRSILTHSSLLRSTNGGHIFLGEGLLPSDLIKGFNKGPSGSEHSPPTKLFNLGLSGVVVKCSGKGRNEGPQSEIPGLTFTFVQLRYSCSFLNQGLYLSLKISFKYLKALYYKKFLKMVNICHLNRS